MSTRGNIARWASDKSLIHDGHLQKILGEGSSLQIVVVGLADSSKEAHRTRPAKLKLEHAEHEAFSLEDLIHSVATIDHVNDFVDGRAVDLFILGSDEDCSGSNQLKLTQGNDLARKESINVVDTEKECLRKEREAMVNLNQPIHQNRAH